MQSHEAGRRFALSLTRKEGKSSFSVMRQGLFSAYLMKFREGGEL